MSLIVYVNPHETGTFLDIAQCVKKKLDICSFNLSAMFFGLSDVHKLRPSNNS